VAPLWTISFFSGSDSVFCQSNDFGLHENNSKGPYFKFTVKLLGFKDVLNCIKSRTITKVFCPSLISAQTLIKSSMFFIDRPSNSVTITLKNRFFLSLYPSCEKLLPSAAKDMLMFIFATVPNLTEYSSLSLLPIKSSSSPMDKSFHEPHSTDCNLNSNFCRSS